GLGRPQAEPDRGGPAVHAGPVLLRAAGAHRDLDRGDSASGPPAPGRIQALDPPRSGSLTDVVARSDPAVAGSPSGANWRRLGPGNSGGGICDRGARIRGDLR